MRDYNAEHLPDLRASRENRPTCIERATFWLCFISACGFLIAIIRGCH